MFTLVYSDGCDDSKRLRSIIESIEPLKQKMHVLTDLDKMDELKITHVPTIVDQSGHRFVTNDAFIWLKKQIEGMGGNPDQFGLSDVDDGSKGGGPRAFS